MNDRKYQVILIVSLIYLTISLACDPAAYRLISIPGLATMSGSSLIFAALYTLLDILTRVAGRKHVYFLIIIFHVCDLMFSYILYTISMMPSPPGHQYLSLNMTLSLLPRLFWSGIVGAIIAGIVEVTIYAFLQGKIKNFILASGISTIVILLAHNVPTEYFALKTLYSDNITEILIANFIVGVMVLLVCTTLGFFALKLIDRYINHEKSRQSYSAL